MKKTKKIAAISVLVALAIAAFVSVNYLWPALQHYDQKQTAEMKRHLEITNHLLAVTKNHQAALAGISAYWQKYGDEKEKESMTKFNSILTNRQKNLGWQKAKLEKTIDANIAWRLAKRLVRGKFPPAEAVFSDHKYKSSYKTILKSAQIHQETLDIMIENAALDAIIRGFKLLDEEIERITKELNSENPKTGNENFLKKLKESEAFIPALIESKKNLDVAETHLKQLERLLSSTDKLTE